jgi:hypothetical protein
MAFFMVTALKTSNLTNSNSVCQKINKFTEIADVYWLQFWHVPWHREDWLQPSSRKHLTCDDTEFWSRCYRCSMVELQ